MKVTTVFLKGNINGKIRSLNFWLTKTMYLIYILLLSAALTIFISHINIDSNILLLANNIKVDNAKVFTFASLQKIYPVFNQSSYIINDNINDKVIRVSNEKDNHFSILDDLNFEEALSVFSKKRNLNITSVDTPTLERLSVDNIKILNYSSLRDINFQALHEKRITLTKLSDKILLYNTHTSESYANSDKYQFDYTGIYRTRDSRYNMLSVGAEFYKNLKEKNMNVIQNTTPHDYAAYDSAYLRSRITINNEIKKNGNFGISLDIHRDASGNLDFAPKVNIKGVEVAQCMFVIGVGTKTNRNPYYEDNLALAMQIQMLAEEVYPGLFRPMFIREYVYNQDLNKYSLLIEVGATGNTLEEAYLAARCITNLLDIIYKR